MGKGQIVQELGDGYYSVQLQLEVSRLQSSREEEAEKLEDIDIPAAQLAVETADQALVNAKTAAVNVIRQYNQDPISVPYSQVHGVWKTIQESSFTLKKAEHTLNQLRLKLASLKKKIARFTPPEEPIVKALCVDLEKELTGLVGTIEPLGERRDDIPVLIAPSGQISSEDGMLQPLQAASTFGAILNLILRPAWQRHMPMYRLGRLVKIDDEYSKCTVILDEAKTVIESNGKTLDLNKEPILVDTPKTDYDHFKYSAVDHVVVRFKNQDWNKPEIIGLAEEALVCTSSYGSVVVGYVAGWTPMYRTMLSTIYANDSFHSPNWPWGFDECVPRIIADYDISEIAGIFDDPWWETKSRFLVGMGSIVTENSGISISPWLYAPGDLGPDPHAWWHGIPVPSGQDTSDPDGYPYPVPDCANSAGVQASGVMIGENVILTSGKKNIAFSRIDFAAKIIRVLLRDPDTGKSNTFWADVADIDTTTNTLALPNEPWVATLTGNEWATVIDIKDVPKVRDGVLSVDEDVPGSGILAADDAEHFVLIATGTQGTATLTNPTTGEYTYTPNPNISGSDSFTFYATNEVGVSDTSATISVTIIEVNDSPVAVGGALETDQNVAYAGTLSGSDVDGDDLVFSVVSQGSKGVATITNAATGAFSYTPNTGANGSDSFTFKVNDGAANSNIATISVTIQNEAPVAEDGILSVTEDQEATGTLTASDKENDSLVFSIVANGSRGVATITDTSTGAYTYTPFPNQNGQDSFTFKASDGISDSNIATVSVTIQPVDDVPKVFNDTLNAIGYTQASGIAQFTNPDGEQLIFSVVENGVQGTAYFPDPSGGIYSYIPNSGASGTDSFSFRVNNSNTATITVILSLVLDGVGSEGGVGEIA